MMDPCEDLAGLLRDFALMAEQKEMTRGEY